MKFTMIRRITALGLILVLAAGIPIQASSASTEKVTEDDASTKSLQEAQDEKAQLEKALKEAQGTIEDLKDSKGDIESKVTELNQQLIDISARITDLENQLTAKSEDIQETKDELAGAKEREAQQYADMKVRIQFMYENGQTSYLEALLSSRNISEFLNSADYIAQIQSYDRQKLTEYQDTVESIVNLEAQLEQEYTDLEALKSTVESNKATVAGRYERCAERRRLLCGGDSGAGRIDCGDQESGSGESGSRGGGTSVYRRSVPVAVPEQHTGDQRLWNESIPDVGSVVEP